MTMQAGRVGDCVVRAKMAELRLICDKEDEICQPRTETAPHSLRQCLQSIYFSAQQTVLNQEKLEKLKGELRAVEDDLVKALSVKTRKEEKKMALSDSFCARRSRVEELKKIVADQRTRKDEFAKIISDQSEALKEDEEKYNQDAECREEFEDAMSWYNKVLGFKIETGRGLKFIFINIHRKNLNEELYFTIRLENNIYYLLDCHPPISEANKLIQELNRTDGFYQFVRTMRIKFQEVAASGNLAEIGVHPQETSVISMSAPFSSVSTDSGSGSRETKKGRRLKGAKSSIGSPGSASSLRRRQSPRFKAKK